MKQFSSAQRNLKALFGGAAVEVKAEPSALDSLNVGHHHQFSAAESVQSAIASPPMLTQKELDLLSGSNDASVESTAKTSTDSLYFTASSIKKERLDPDLMNAATVSSHKLLPVEITHKNASLSDGNKLSPETLLQQDPSQLNVDGSSLKALSAKTSPVNMRERNAMIAELGNCSPFNLPYPDGKSPSITHNNPPGAHILTTRQYGKVHKSLTVHNTCREIGGIGTRKGHPDASRAAQGLWL